MLTLSREADGLLARAEVPEHALASLTALAALAEPPTVPRLALLAFCGLDEIRRAASLALDRSLAAASARDLVHIDVACRQLHHTNAFGSREWEHLTALHLRALDAIGPAMHGAWIVASFHPNGYVREAAVRRMAEWSFNAAGGRELSALALRVNDWVPEVATRAAAAVERRVTLEYAAAWMLALPMLQRLGPNTRRPAQALQERVESLLREPEARGVMLNALHSDHPSVGRDAIRLLLAAPLTTEEHVKIVTLAMQNVDAVVRDHAATFVYRRFSEPAVAALVPVLLADRSAPVRQRGLAALSEHGDRAAAIALERALLDHSAAVREIARFGLRRLGFDTPFVDVYRHALTTAQHPRELAIAVRGLGETGRPEHVSALVAVIDHAQPRVRVAVVRALATLDAVGSVGIRLASLHDPAPRVTRAARDTLRRQVTTVGVDAIRAAIRDVPYTHGRRDALALSANFAKWDCLLVLLEAGAITDPVMHAAAHEGLTRWLERQNLSFTAPPSWQLAELQRLVEQGALQLSAPMQRELTRLFDFWAR